LSELKTNLNEVSKQMDKYLKMSTTEALKQVLYLACEMIGFKAVSDYMIQTAGIKSAMEKSHPTKLTVRTGRMAGSIVSAPRFSQSELPSNTLTSIAFKSKPITIQSFGGIQEGITSVVLTPNGAEAIKGTKVPYAEKHEMGFGVTQRPFLNPALRDTKGSILEVMEKTFIHQGRVHGF